MNKTWVCAVAALALLGGCNKKPAASSAAGESQVAALVNEGEISVHQVETLLRLQPALGARFGEQASPRALDSLIEQELAAQAAMQAGLDTSPQTLQALALARREVLARAYQDQLAEKASLPDTSAVERYYDEHPELSIGIYKPLVFSAFVSTVKKSTRTHLEYSGPLLNDWPVLEVKRAK